jgi:hypothetical protein
MERSFNPSVVFYEDENTIQQCAGSLSIFFKER